MGLSVLEKRRLEPKGNIIDTFTTSKGCKITVRDIYLQGKTREECLEIANAKSKRFKITYSGESK